jgi:hypothetical protein
MFTSSFVDGGCGVKPSISAGTDAGCVDVIEDAAGRRDVITAWLDVSKMSRLSW